MKTIKTRLLAVAASAVASAGLMAPASSQAAIIQLGFILDGSGSITRSEFNIIRQGLATAMGIIPVAGPNTYEVSIVQFSTNAVVEVNRRLINSLGARNILVDSVLNITQDGGATNYEAGFRTMLGVLNGAGTAVTGDFTYVNFATDGQPNTCGMPGNVTEPGLTGAQTCAQAGRDALVAAGVDNISIEAIGLSSGAAFLQNSICYPGPCDTTAPYDFPTQGFYIAVANATGYAEAIQNKVRIVTGQPEVPEPATLALLGLGLAGAGFAARRRKALAA